MGPSRDDAAKPGPEAATTEHPILDVLRTAAARRVLAGYLVFNTAEWATWIALLVWAFDTGGATAAGIVAVVQLVPATLAAPFAASVGDRMRRDSALALGYAVQAVTMLVVAVVLAADLPTAVVYVTAALASTSLVLTRPVHNAILPEIAETPGQITAGNAASSTVEGFGVFIGPILTGVLLAVSGPAMVFFLMGIASVGTALLNRSLPLRREFERDDDAESTVKATVAGIHALRYNSGALLLTLVVGAQFVVVGVLDLLAVVLGIDVLDMGPSGPGILTSAIGAGALVGAAATILLIGRPKLSPAVAGGMLLTGIPIALVAFANLPPVAWVLLALSGMGKAFVDVAGRTLLQRAVKADVLSRIFGVQESMLMGGRAIGSATAPLLVNHLGAKGAFIATGVFLPSVGLLAWTQIRKLDPESLQPGPGFARLEAIPMFAILPQPTLEQLSRDLVSVSVPAGTDVFAQGDEGDLFYVIDRGRVSIIQDGAEIAVTEPGGFFGEIALLRDIPRTATAHALDDVELYTLERDVFLEAVTGSSISRELADAEADRRLHGDETS